MWVSLVANASSEQLKNYIELLNHFRYAKCKDKYTPKEAHLPGFCYCGFKMGESQAECVYCSSSLYKAVYRSAQKAELDDEICNMLSVLS